MPAVGAEWVLSSFLPYQHTQLKRTFPREGQYKFLGFPLLSHSHATRLKSLMTLSILLAACHRIIFFLFLFITVDLFFLREIAFFCHLLCCNWVLSLLILSRDWLSLKCSASLISIVDWKKINKSPFVHGLMKFYFLVVFSQTCTPLDCLSSHEVFGYFTFHHDIQHYCWPGSKIFLPLLFLLLCFRRSCPFASPSVMFSLLPLLLLLLLGATSPASCTQQKSSVMLSLMPTHQLETLSEFPYLCCNFLWTLIVC